MQCEKHEEFFSKIVKVEESIDKLNNKVDSKFEIMENKIDSKFEMLTSDLLKNNKELCNSIINLNGRADTNKKEITKSRNLLVNGTIASIAGIIGALITKML